MLKGLHYYHGTEHERLKVPQQGMYLTPRADYNYIQSMPVCYTLTLSPRAPYFVDTVNAIESLRSAPERLSMIAQLGYDIVAYCAPGDPYTGASGWPSDAAQYVIIEPSIVTSMTRSERPEVKPAHGTPPPIIKNVYHSAGAHFAQFDDPDNIGFHFGTRRAASARAKARHDNIADDAVEHVMPNDIDLWRARYADEAALSTPQEMLLHIMTKKLHHPKSNIETVVATMTPEELAACIVEMNNKPDIPGYQEAVMRGKASGYFTARVRGVEHGKFATREIANAYKQAISDRLTKKASLIMGSPIQLPDLGLWHSHDIIRALPLSTEKRKEGLRLPTEQAQYAWCRQVLKGMGYDGIQYTNKVEDAGSTSYIALNASQIHVHQPRLPELPLSLTERIDAPAALRVRR